VALVALVVDALIVVEQGAFDARLVHESARFDGPDLGQDLDVVVDIARRQLDAGGDGLIAQVER
jgi:hypothetical protein